MSPGFYQLSGGAARDGGHRGACPNKVLLVVTLTAAVVSALAPTKAASGST